MDESQSQKGRTEMHFVYYFFNLPSDVLFCHCSAHPPPSVSWDSFVCERRQHTCPAGGRVMDFFFFCVCTYNLHLFLGAIHTNSFHHSFGFLFFSKNRWKKTDCEFLIKPFTRRLVITAPITQPQFCRVCLQTNIYEQIVWVGGARGDGRHGRVCVVLEAGQTDGWTDAWIDGWMEEVGVARRELGGKKRGIRGR